MALIPEYSPGATPLSPEELHGLIPSFVTTQGALNEFEQANILHSMDWADKSRQDILTEKFVLELHKHMFGETWKWVGNYNTSDKNIGCPAPIFNRNQCGRRASAPSTFPAGNCRPWRCGRPRPGVPVS